MHHLMCEVLVGCFCLVTQIVRAGVAAPGISLTAEAYITDTDSPPEGITALSMSIKSD